MRCYYEILGVTKDVSDEELKKSYRKLALKWHPDKNPDNVAEAKEQFQLVQQAYDVLGDAHERSWYDSHRESILKGAGSDYKDDSLDVFQYFTTSCFQGYGDEEGGFYAVYNEVFNKLAAEDAEYVADEGSDFEIPSFGNSNSSYEDVVHPFYAYWQSYSTKKSYAWLDPYNIRDAPNRRIVRSVEKENKKVRDKARKQRNEEVRNLVVFVRKRDKRVQAHAKLLEERATKNAKKIEEKRKQHIKERQEAMKNYKESDWTKFSNIEKELKVIEASLAAEFGDSDVSSCGEYGGDKEEIFETPLNLYCVACNKVFKTEKAFSNHENSKKHKESVEVLKASVLDEEEELAVSGSKQKEEAPVCDHLEITYLSGLSSDSDVSLQDELEESKAKERLTKKKNKKQNRNRIVNICNVTDDSASDSEFQMSSGWSKKQCKKQQQTMTKVWQNAPCNEDSEENKANSNSIGIATGKANEDFDICTGKVKGKKAKDIRKSKVDILKEGQVNNRDGAADVVEVDGKMDNVELRNKRVKKKGKKDGHYSTDNVRDLNHCCVTCCSEFPSKNKLFDHLKQTGHSVFIPQLAGTAAKEKVGDRVKGKTKKSK